jgi:hypothetical protein
LTYNNSYQANIDMAPFEGRVIWTQVYLPTLLGGSRRRTAAGTQTTAVIAEVRRKLKAAQDRQKSYSDNRRRKLSFQDGEHVFVKVSPIQGWFGVQGQLKPRYIGPFEILQRVGPVAYRLALPPRLTEIHDVFHVSNLRKYIPDESHVIQYEDLPLQPNPSKKSKRRISKKKTRMKSIV